MSSLSNDLFSNTKSMKVFTNGVDLGNINVISLKMSNKESHFGLIQ